MSETGVGKLCGRSLSVADLETMRRAIVEADPPVRAEVARWVYAALGWHDTLGRPKLMSCRVGLLRRHPAGLMRLPAAVNGNARGLVQQSEPWQSQQPLAGSAGQLERSALGASRLWNGLIERGHYLGYTPLPGAQLRYLIESDHGVLGALGFGTVARKVAAGDRRIGRERPEREAHLGRVLNNARFLILPWVQVQNLASKILALAADLRAALGVA